MSTSEVHPKHFPPTNGALLLVAIFQFISGIPRIIGMVTGLPEIANEGAISILEYGVFPILVTITGIMLWLRGKVAFLISILLQLVQVPVIETNQFTFNLGLPIRFVVSTNFQLGDQALALGFNVLNLIALTALLKFPPAPPAVGADPAAQAAPPAAEADPATQEHTN